MFYIQKWLAFYSTEINRIIFNKIESAPPTNLIKYNNITKLIEIIRFKQYNAVIDRKNTVTEFLMFVRNSEYTVIREREIIRNWKPYHMDLIIVQTTL